MVPPSSGIARWCCWEVQSKFSRVAAQDYATRDLFEKLMADEEHHIDFLETQLDLVGRLGLELYAQHHIGKMGEGED